MRNSISPKFSFVVLFILMMTDVFAHEVRPAYLEIKETSSNQYKVFWKIPVLSGRIPNLYPQFDPSLQLIETSNLSSFEASTTEYYARTSSSIQGRIVRIVNLEKTLIDVILRIDFLDGASHTILLQPDQPEVLIPITASSWRVVQTFVLLGIEHILFGWDHFLFVLGLLLLIDGRGNLFWTITSFTVAHSITLAMATFGHLSLSAAPVEAVIALSVIFLAREYLSKTKGKESITIQWPWIVAFIFGLLHGFGFAGALMDIGLPTHAIPLSLFTFNAGVEIGQLIIVAVGLITWLLFKKTAFKLPSYLYPSPGYAIGGIASFWFISRILDIVA